MSPLTCYPTLLKSVLPLIVIAMVVSGFAIGTLGFFSAFPVHLAALRVSYKLRTEYLKAVYRQDRYWHDKHKPGEILAGIGADILAFQEGIGMKMVRRINTHNT